MKKQQEEEPDEEEDMPDEATPAANSPPAEPTKTVLRVRLIDPEHTFGVAYPAAAGKEELLFDKANPEQDVPSELEERVRSNMACPFPDVYDVHAELSPEVQFRLNQINMRAGMPRGKVAKRRV